MQKGEDRRHKDEGGDRCQREAADDGAAERRVLLAAITEAKCHGEHTDDHSEGCHADGTEASGAGFDCREQCVARDAQAILGEGDDEDGVCGWQRPCT